MKRTEYLKAHLRCRAFRQLFSKRTVIASCCEKTYFRSAFFYMTAASLRAKFTCCVICGKNSAYPLMSAQKSTLHERVREYGGADGEPESQEPYPQY